MDFKRHGAGVWVLEEDGGHHRISQPNCGSGRLESQVGLIFERDGRTAWLRTSHVSRGQGSQRNCSEEETNRTLQPGTLQVSCKKGYHQLEKENMGVGWGDCGIAGRAQHQGPRRRQGCAEQYLGC